MKEPVDLEKLRPRRGTLWNLMAVDLGDQPGPPEAVYPSAPQKVNGSYSSGHGPDLAIDFGTSAIAAALVGGNHAVEVLRFGDEELLASPFGRRRSLDRSRLADNYELSYGYLGSGPPDSGQDFYPCLKRRIEHLARCHGDNGWRHEATLDVAAVCQLALGRARDRQGKKLADRLGNDFQIFITVPNAFPRAAVEVLRRGVAFGVAATLGQGRLPVVRALLEAEAVAYAHLLKPRLDAPSRRTTLLVVDAGAGTTDASIVRAEAGELRVLAHVGLPVGGMDLDTLIASLKGSFTAQKPFDLMQRLEASRQAKQHHLGRPGAHENLGSRFEALARDLVQNNGWPASSPQGQSVATEIQRAHERYLALAVRGLIRALPASELTRVDDVVLSGRGSLLAGFQEAVRAAVAEHGPSPEPRSAPTARERKLAVVRGVGAYVASTYGNSWDRRPVRSCYEIYLRHEDDRELALVDAGQPLDRGWGSAAWHQPARELGAHRTRPRLELRMVPRDVLRSLANEGSFDQKELEELLRWSVLPVLRIDERPPPYSARLAFDFLSLQARLEVEGEEIRTLGQSPTGFGRRHPVHQLDDAWFELSAGG